MRKIAIAAAVSLSLSGVTTLSYALGLGEIEMYSALNQTLDAEIAILSASDAELRGMDVRLASASAFARAGLDQSPVLSTVDFSVDRRPDGKAVVKITSDTPVLEPFLNFLIEVDAPGSVTLVREYTVLLNPATFAGGQTGSQTGSQSSGEQMSVASGSSDVFANSASDGTGVAIDLSDAIPSGFASNERLAGNDTGNEVIFTESAGGNFTDANGSAATLFVPDDQVFSNGTVGSTVVDSDGQVISLTQELNTTPQFDNPSMAGGEEIQLTGIGQELSLDNLGAQGDDSGNAIFTNEFESGQSELISSAELQGLVGDVATATPIVDFQESTAADVFVADFSGTDADAQGGVGDLIDLSGLVDDSSSVFVEEVPVSTGTATNIELSGDSYRIRSQDTLWSIANARKARGVTTHQMVVALVDANPQAFIGGNMNRMISGAVLQIPTEASQSSVERSSAVAIVQSWTRGNTPPARSSRNIIQPATRYEETEIVVDNSNSSFSTDFNNNLDDVNQRYEEVQTEIATGTVVRDELQGRVNSLTDNMEEMKSLITVRENELNQLQDEVQAAESNAAAIDAQISQLSNATDSVAAVQQGLSRELQQAQDAISMQADADKNLATAEAEAQSVRLSSEEDALRSQLAALALEKRDLEATSQLEKAALVREAEVEKSRLLAQAKTERENILAELEVEKSRISSEAEMEIARVSSDAELENQRMLNQAQVESDQMQAQLQQMEAEKTRLMEESNNAVLTQPETLAAAQSDEPSRVKDRLAELQREGGDKATEVQTSISKAVDTDAVKLGTDTDAGGMVGDTVSGITDAGKSMAAGGAAAVGGLLGFAPLQEMVGNRKVVLGAGAGLAFLGLLGAWGVRRRKTRPPEVKGLRPRGEGRPVVAPKAQTKANYDREEAMYGDADETYTQPQRRKSSSAAAAAAAAAAAVTGTAAVATSRGNDSTDQEKPLKPKAAEQSQPTAQPTAETTFTEVTTPPSTASTVPAPQATAAAPPVDIKSADVVEPTATQETFVEKPVDAVEKPLDAIEKPVGAVDKVDAELEEKALDDTITEAEVYLRYGLHGQAEDLLKTAIERSPNNEEYHFKLLENYHDQKNGDDFNTLADKFQGKFPNSGHKARIAEMGAEITGGNVGVGSNIAGGIDSAAIESTGSGLGLGGALAAGAAGAAAMATGAAASAKDVATDGYDSLTGADNEMDSDLLDQTIDPGSEFSVDELQATGNLGALTDDEFNFSDHSDTGQGGLGLGGVDQGGMSLDDVDLASLDDDGTMNLEEIAGSQMSGSDLGTLDLTNPGFDSPADLDTSFENLSFEEPNLGGVAGGIHHGLDTDLASNNPIAGGTDEMETMLDLAKAYMDMGDSDNASKALQDIAARGNPLQQTEAAELLKKLS